MFFQCLPTRIGSVSVSHFVVNHVSLTEANFWHAYVGSVSG